MIRHICMFKFLDFAEGRTKAENIAITNARAAIAGNGAKKTP